MSGDFASSLLFQYFKCICKVARRTSIARLSPGATVRIQPQIVDVIAGWRLMKLSWRSVAQTNAARCLIGDAARVNCWRPARLRPDAVACCWRGLHTLYSSPFCCCRELGQSLSRGAELVTQTCLSHRRACASSTRCHSSVTLALWATIAKRIHCSSPHWQQLTMRRRNADGCSEFLREL